MVETDVSGQGKCDKIKKTKMIWKIKKRQHGGSWHGQTF